MGKTISKKGYVLINNKALTGRPQVYEHRWIIEQYLGRILGRNEHIHHINDRRSVR